MLLIGLILTRVNMIEIGTGAQCWCWFQLWPARSTAFPLLRNVCMLLFAQSGPRSVCSVMIGRRHTVYLCSVCISPYWFFPCAPVPQTGGKWRLVYMYLSLLFKIGNSAFDEQHPFRSTSHASIRTMPLWNWGATFASGNTNQLANVSNNNFTKIAKNKN